MEELVKSKLARIFPRATITIQEDYGLMRIYISLENYFMHESIINVIGKGSTKIVKQATNEFIEHLVKFTINENAYLDIIGD